VSQNERNSSWCGSDHLQATITENGGPSVEYLAGYWDGEGCFSSNIPDENAPQFTVSLSSTHEDIIQTFKERFGGWISSYDPENPNHSKWWRWETKGGNARVFAETLLPHLREKQEQCRIFIDAISYKQQHLTKNSYTDKEIDTIEEYSKNVRGMNSGQRRFKDNG
jgi:hypothetical protein